MIAVPKNATAIIAFQIARARKKLFRAGGSARRRQSVRSEANSHQSNNVRDAHNALRLQSTCYLSQRNLRKFAGVKPRMVSTTIAVICVRRAALH